MGSVMSDHPCKKCLFKYGFLDIYYRSGEGTFFCKQCGYSESRFLEWDGKEPIKTPDGALKYKETENGGCGTYRLKQKGQIATSVGNFPILNNLEKGRREFEAYFQKNKDEIDDAQMTYFEDGEWYNHNLITGEKLPYYVYHQIHEGHEMQPCKCGGLYYKQDDVWKSRFFCDKGCGEYIDVSGNRDLCFVKREEIETNGG